MINDVFLKNAFMIVIKFVLIFPFMKKSSLKKEFHKYLTSLEILYIICLSLVI